MISNSLGFVFILCKMFFLHKVDSGSSCGTKHVLVAAAVGMGCVLSGILCIGDAAGVHQFHRSSRYLLMILGFVMLLVSAPVWIELMHKCDAEGLPVSNTTKLNLTQTHSRYAVASVAMLTGVAIIYSLNLLFPYNAEGAYPYIIFRSIILDICEILAISLGLAAMVVRGYTSVSTLQSGEYSKIRRDSADSESPQRYSWSSTVGVVSRWPPFSLFSTDDGSMRDRSQYHPPILFPLDFMESVDGSARSLSSTRSDNIEELIRYNFMSGIESEEENCSHNCVMPSTARIERSGEGATISANGTGDNRDTDSVFDDDDVDNSSWSSFPTVYVSVGARYDSASPPVMI